MNGPFVRRKSDPEVRAERRMTRQADPERNKRHAYTTCSPPITRHGPLKPADLMNALGITPPASTA